MSLLKEKIELEIEEAELAAQRGLSQFPPLLKWLFIMGILAIIPCYFIARFASQKYWEKKYAPQILSAHPSFTAALEPKLLDLSLTTTGENTYAAVATISNPNLDLAADNVDYTFNFLDASGNPIPLQSGNPSGKTFFLPNEKQYLSIPRFTVEGTIDSVKLNFDSAINWQKKLFLPKVPLQAEKPNFFQQLDPVAFVVEGYYKNNSPYLLKKVRLTFLVYDSSKNLIASSQRDEFDLAPYERRAYKQLWPGVGGGNVASVNVIPQTNTLDTSNITLPDEPEGPASDLGRPKTR